MRNGIFAAEIEALRSDPEFIAELVALDVLEQAVRRMKERQITKASLAATLGVSRSAVSQLFAGGPHNLGMLTMVRLAAALDGDLTIQISDRAEQASAPNAMSRLDFAKELSNGQTAEAQEFATAA